MNRLPRIAGVVSLILLAAAVIWVVVRPGPADRLADLIAEMQAQGEPVTIAEFDRPLPAVKRNGALDLEAARSWFEDNKPEGDWQTLIGTAWKDATRDPSERTATPEQIEELRELLVSFAPLFEHLDRMAAADEIAWALGPRVSVDDKSKSAVDVTLLMWPRNFLLARSLDGATPEERLAGIRATLALGIRVRTLTAIEHMVAIMVHKEGALALRNALERGDLDPAEARRQLNALLEANWTKRFPTMVRAERAWLLELLPHAIDGSLDWSPGGTNPSSWERLAERMARLVGAGGGAASPSPDDCIVWAREMGDSLHAMPEEVWRHSLTAAGSANQMTKLSGMTAGNMCEADAVAGLARIALAAYSHRRLNGDWPVSTADLAPLFPRGVPVDPFTGEAFELSREGDVLVLRAQPWKGFLNRPEEAHEKGLIWHLPPR